MFVLSILVTFRESGTIDVAHTTAALENAPLYSKEAIGNKVREYIGEVLKKSPEREIISVSHSLIY